MKFTKSKNKVIILCGGRGKRMGRLTNSIPKYGLINDGQSNNFNAFHVIYMILVDHIRNQLSIYD